MLKNIIFEADMSDFFLEPFEAFFLLIHTL